MDHSTLHFQLRVDKNSHLPEARNTATMLNQRVCVCVQLVFGHRDMDARKCHCPK